MSNLRTIFLSEIRSIIPVAERQSLEHVLANLGEDELAMKLHRVGIEIFRQIVSDFSTRIRTPAPMWRDVSGLRQWLLEHVAKEEDIEERNRPSYAAVLIFDLPDHCQPHRTWTNRYPLPILVGKILTTYATSKKASFLKDIRRRSWMKRQIAMVLRKHEKATYRHVISPVLTRMLAPDRIHEDTQVA